MRKLLPWVVLVTAPGWMACGSVKPAPVAALVKKRPVPEVAAVAAIPSTPYVYAYNPTGKRDPFRSPVSDTQRDATIRSSVCSEPLCQYELDQLTLVAVVTGDSNPFAMVEDTEGRGFVVHRNTRMGKQGGKVTQILRDALTVTEVWTGPDGKTTSNPLTVKMKADDAEEKATNFLTGRAYP